MSWFPSFSSCSKSGTPAKAGDVTSSKSEPVPSTSNNADKETMTEPRTVNLEFSFLCGICHEYLTNPRMCSACRYKSCDSCFKKWFQQLKKLKMVTKCPQCNAVLTYETLLHVPNLDELDRKLTAVQSNFGKLETAVANLFQGFSEKIRKIEVATDDKINETRKCFLEKLKTQMTKVTKEIDELNEKQKNSNKLSEQKVELKSDVKAVQPVTVDTNLAIPGTSTCPHASKVPLSRSRIPKDTTAKITSIPKVGVKRSAVNSLARNNSAAKKSKSNLPNVNSAAKKSSSTLPNVNFAAKYGSRSAANRK